MQIKQSSNGWLWSSIDTAIAAIATLLCLLVVYVDFRGASFSTVLAQRLSIKNILLLMLFTVLWTGLHQMHGLYRNPLEMPCRTLLTRALSASALGSAVFVLFPLFSSEHRLPIGSVLVFFLVAALASVTVRSALWPILPRMSAARHQRPLKTLIVGSGPLAWNLYGSLDANIGQSVVGFVDTPGPHTVQQIEPCLRLGDLAELEQVLMSTAIDEVLIALPVRSCYDQIKHSITVCERAGVPVNYQFQLFSHTLGFSQVREHANQRYISWRPSRVEESGAAAKRSVDVVLAVISLVLLSPLLLVIAVVIKLGSKGPIFFTQERYGLNKQRFRMVKFRTMVPDAEAKQASLESRNEAQGPVFKIRNDPRVTPIGRFLRKASLDELPQLVNVLKGDMSLVGPRPLPLRDVANFSDACSMRRFSVKPGLTCLWQIRGRSDTNFDQWIAYDLEYIDSWTPLLDFKILMMTIPVVIRGNGAV